MNRCLKCGAEFSNCIEIDGKWRNLQRRLYCLTCSPFGEHNTKKLHEEENKKPKAKHEIYKVKICKTCNNEFKTKGRECGTCKTRKRRAKSKLRAIEMLGGKCEKCGFSKHPAALQFHHHTRNNKEIAVGRILNKSWAVIEEELKKCKLLCANCHAIEHSKRYDDLIVDL